MWFGHFQLGAIMNASNIRTALIFLFFIGETAVAGSIHVWTRPAKSPVQPVESQINPKNDFPLVHARAKTYYKVYDSQYGKKISIQGFTLKSLIKSYGDCKSCDVVHLHYKNGVKIPISLDAIRKNPKALILAIRYYYKGAFVETFPKIKAKMRNSRSPKNPLRFSWNKTIVNDPAVVLSNGGQAKNPFIYATSLVGIELTWKDPPSL
jgi:hypothetical protein